MHTAKLEVISILFFMKTQAVKVIYSNWLNRGLGKVGQGGFSGRKNSSEILSGTNPPPRKWITVFSYSH